MLDEQWDSPELAAYRSAFPEAYRDDRNSLEEHVRDLVDRDVKAPYLKSLQGHLWQHGYQTGELKAPLFSDVAPFMKAAHARGKKVVIYSSGSVQAQKLLFGHTNAEPSDMKPLITDWFDTVNAGPKTDAASYRKILSHYPKVGAVKWLFFSDNLSEVDAALQAGMRSLPLARPGNPALPLEHPLTSRAIADFTAASEEKGMAAIAATQETKELDGTIEK